MISPGTNQTDETRGD